MPPGPEREWHSQLPPGGHGLGMADEELERRPQRGRADGASLGVRLAWRGGLAR